MFRRFIALSIIFLSAFGIVIGSLMMVQSIKFSNMAEIVEGTVTSLREEKTKDANTVYRIVFSYKTKKGKTFSAPSSIATNPPMKNIGDKIWVQYIRNNPAHARIKSQMNWVFPFTLVVPGIGVIILCIIYLIKLEPISYRRKRWKCPECSTKNSSLFDTCYKCKHKIEISIVN